MRKITQQAVEALLNGRAFHSGNTQVVDGVMYLHGNAIASLQFKDGKPFKVGITHAGWGSVTTRDRLNGALSELFPDALHTYRVRQMKGKQRLVQYEAGVMSSNRMDDKWYFMRVE